MSETSSLSNEPVLPPASDAELLIDGETIGGHFVKPWTIRKCAEVAPLLERVMVELKKRKLTFKDFIHVTKDSEGKDVVSVLNLDQLFFAVSPVMPDLLIKTLDITEEEMNKIAQDDSLPLFICIVRQNLGYIKNSFALMSSVVRTVAVLSA